MRYRTVIFDWDSTLSRIEGIEELARARHREVVELTEAAMRGEVALEEVYGRRLELAAPTRAQVEGLVRAYVDALVPDAREVIAVLHAAGADVRVVSGGLRRAVAGAAAALGIEADRVAAVDVYFRESGEYAGFDEASPLAYAGGKRVVVERWAPGLKRPVMLVGDGATDLEAKPVVDCFVAFAGVVERPAVAAAADAVIHAPSLAPVVPLVLGDVAPPEPLARALHEKGLALLRTGVVGNGS